MRRTVTRWIQSGAPFWGTTSGGKTWTCQNVGLPIPDNDANGLTDLVYVGPAQISKEVMVELDLQHTFLNDLVVTLTNLDTELTKNI